MTTGIIMFILFFVILFVVIIFREKSRTKKMEEESIKRLESDRASGDSSHSAPPTHATPLSTLKESPSQVHTVYEYHALKSKHTCPFCDGENEGAVETCSVCGHNLR